MKEVESITFDTANSKIVVLYSDGQSKDYLETQEYLKDNPSRLADCIAMNWIVNNNNNS